MEIDKLYKTHFLTTAKALSVCDDVVKPEEIMSYSAAKVDEKDLENQKDLLKIVSVLVSCGVNQNDDAFIAEEVWPVRHTGAHKPLDIEHNPKEIVGHMIRTYAAKSDGTVITGDVMPEKSDFDIIAESVLYKYMFPDLAEDVKNLSKSNKLFVSIEAWFTAYSYLVGNKIVARNAETASILDPVLRVNGGNGVYEGKRVARVLRNMIIGGIGLVKTPANPTSIIKSVASLHSQDVDDNINNEIIMANVVGDVFHLSTNSLKSKETEMDKDILEEISQVIAAQRAASTATVESKADDKPVETAPEIKVLLERIAVLENKVQASEQNVESAERSEILKGLGLDQTFIVANLSDWFFSTRADFNKTVSLIKALKVIYTPQVIASPAATVEAPKTETPKVEEAPKVEVKETKEVTTPKAPEVKAPETTQEVATEEVTEDVISLEEIEKLDKEVKIETDTNKPEASLTEKMGNVVQMFLKTKNPKWGNLALKE